MEQVVSQDAHPPLPSLVRLLLDRTADAGQLSVVQHVKPVDHTADAVRRMAIVAQRPTSQYGFAILEKETNIMTSCGTGCQSGCTSGGGSAGGSAGSTSTSKPPAAASTEPVLGKPTTSPVSSGPQTTDGTCGAANGNTVCGNWANGACCSMYGVSFHVMPRRAWADSHSSAGTPPLTAVMDAKVDHARVPQSSQRLGRRQHPSQPIQGRLKFFQIPRQACKLG